MRLRDVNTKSSHERKNIKPCAQHVVLRLCWRESGGIAIAATIEANLRFESRIRYVSQFSIVFRTYK